MTLSEIFTMLNGITSMTGKVAFDLFPETLNQSLPYINIQCPTTYTFGADNITYYQKPNVNIELYSKRKDTTTESAIETALTTNGIYYTKHEGRIESQSCYQVVYEI